MRDCEYNFKILIVGSHGVGKTSILSSFCGDSLRITGMSTTLRRMSIEFKTKVISLEGTRVKLQMWDMISGDDSMLNLSVNYYKDVDAIIIVYSLTDRTSFNTIDYWLKTIRDNCNNIPLVVVAGNKCDEIHCRALSHGEIALFPFTRPGVVHFETSAEKRINIDQLFTTISLALMEKEKLLSLPAMDCDRNGLTLSSSLDLTNDYVFSSVLSKSTKDLNKDLFPKNQIKKKSNCSIL